MNALRTGIYTELTGTANDFAAAVGNRIYYGMAPQSTICPYAVFHILSGNHDFTFREKFDRVTIQFNLFDDSSSPTELETIYGYLITLFDNASLSVSGYTSIWCNRTVTVPARWIDVEQVWQISVRYDIFLQDT